MTRMLDDGSAAARMIADACTVAAPAVRFSAQAQRPLDWAQRLNDHDFLKRSLRSSKGFRSPMMPAFT